MIHPPKKISSQAGLGLNTTKKLRFITHNLAIGTETWPEIETPWAEGETVIAQAEYTWVTRWETDKPYIITKFYNAKSEEVGIYCDISRPVQRVAGGFVFDDLYLDVWQPFGEKAVLLDEDELTQALEVGHITQAEAEAAYVASGELLAILNSETIQLDSLHS